MRIRCGWCGTQIPTASCNLVRPLTVAQKFGIITNQRRNNWGRWLCSWGISYEMLQPLFESNFFDEQQLQMCQQNASLDLPILRLFKAVSVSGNEPGFLVLWVVAWAFLRSVRWCCSSECNWRLHTTRPFAGAPQAPQFLPKLTVTYSVYQKINCMITEWQKDDNSEGVCGHVWSKDVHRSIR